MDREAVLARTMIECADVLVDDFDVLDLLTTLTGRCVEILDVDAAGVMLAEGRKDRLQPVASSSKAIRALEVFEEQSEEGSCPDCYRSGLLMTLDNQPRPHHGGGGVAPLRPPSRRYRVQVGARPAHATAGKHDRGVEPVASNGPLGAEDLVVAQAFADAATIAILQERALRDARDLAGQLQGALESRILIEQAKGIVSEAVGADMDRAFRLIRQHARNHNQKLTNVAAAIVTRTLLPATLGPVRATRVNGP